MNQKTFKVTGIGAALVDTELRVSPQFLEDSGIEKGVMTLVDETRQDELTNRLSAQLTEAKKASGGSACNTLIALAQLGSQASYVCLIAEDENGVCFRQDAQKAGLRLLSESSASGKTGKCLVFVTPDADRTMNTYLGVSEQVSSKQLSPEAIVDADMLYVEGYLVTSDSGRQAAKDAMQIARDADTQTAISLSDPAMVEFFKEGLAEMIGPGVNYLFCNADEAFAWTQTSSIEAACKQLQAIANQVVITLGADGAMFSKGEQIVHVPSAPIKAVDTNGAGDMFAGAFLHAVGQGYTLERAAAFGNHAAGQVVQDYGPRLTEAQYQAVKDALR